MNFTHFDDHGWLILNPPLDKGASGTDLAQLDEESWSRLADSIAPPPSRRSRREATENLRWRRRAVLGALLLDLAAVAATLAHLTGSVRVLLGLGFLLFVPGLAIVGWLRLSWPAAELSLTVALSLSLVLLGSQIMLWAHWWHPVSLQVLLGALSAALLLGQLLRKQPPGMEPESVFFEERS
jgi:hypothetical protein